MKTSIKAWVKIFIFSIALALLLEAFVLWLKKPRSNVAEAARVIAPVIQPGGGWE
jgi:hypothetical protein